MFGFGSSDESSSYASVRENQSIATICRFWRWTYDNEQFRLAQKLYVGIVYQRDPAPRLQEVDSHLALLTVMTLVLNHAVLINSEKRFRIIKRKSFNLFEKWTYRGRSPGVDIFLLVTLARWIGQFHHFTNFFSVTWFRFTFIRQRRFVGHRWRCRCLRSHQHIGWSTVAWTQHCYRRYRVGRSSLTAATMGWYVFAWASRRTRTAVA